MTDGGLAHVFVVDDDPQVRASIRGLLKSSGLRSECFETAERNATQYCRLGGEDFILEGDEDIGSVFLSGVMWYGRGHEEADT